VSKKKPLYVFVYLCLPLFVCLKILFVFLIAQYRSNRSLKLILSQIKISIKIKSKPKPKQNKIEMIATTYVQKYRSVNCNENKSQIKTE
jgi:hypothetical protein